MTVKGVVAAVLVLVFLPLGQLLTIGHGPSMLPTLPAEETFVFADLLAYEIDQPRRGDIVLLRPPNNNAQLYSKRIVGLPGETIEVNNGYVYIDGLLLNEPYDPVRGGGYTPPTWVPADHYFVLGDNRPQSFDSRGFGPVPRERILERVWLAEQSDGRWHQYGWPYRGLTSKLSETLKDVASDN